MPQIYSLWLKLTQKNWRMDDDQLISAAKLLQHWALKHPDQISAIESFEEPGMQNIGFAFRSILLLLGPKTREAALDGTCMFHSVKIF
jgi:hypothetical protein